MIATWKSIIGASAIAASLLVLGVSQAQAAGAAEEQAKRQVEQPLNNAPLWREVRSGDTQTNTSTVKSGEATVLINPQGQTWRQFRNGPVTVIGGALVLIVAAAILIFYKVKGTLRLHEPPTGRLIQRFKNWERFAHWSTAISFVVLAITGLIMFFGKHILLPVLGYTLFSWIAKLAITLHNVVGPWFAVSVVLLFFTFLGRNDWKPYDKLWLKKFGGLASGEHVPSGFFNAGEKIWFWGGLTIMGVIVSISGFVLDFANFNQSRNTMQIANIIHVVGALLFICGSLGHIYMGTLGMAGAFNAMRTGQVDETWAKEHHEYWYNDVKSGKASEPAQVPAMGEGLIKR